MNNKNLERKIEREMNYNRNRFEHEIKRCKAEHRKNIHISKDTLVSLFGLSLTIGSTIKLIKTLAIGCKVDSVGNIICLGREAILCNGWAKFGLFSLSVLSLAGICVGVYLSFRKT